MIIAEPDPAAPVDVEGIDLLDTALYTRGDPHSVWQALRAQHPVFWSVPPGTGGIGFWSVTRYSDVRMVLRDHEAFTSEKGTVLSLLGTDDPAGGSMMAVTDPPRHSLMRGAIGKPLSARAVPDYASWIRELVVELIEPARHGDVFDAARIFARLPVEIIVRLMDLPRDDIDMLLRWAYGCVAPSDPHYLSGNGDETEMYAHHGLIGYFDEAISDRRRALSNDLLSHILTMDFDGGRMPEEDVIANCYSLLLGGAITTSQVIGATLLGLVEQNDGEGRWEPGIPEAAAVEEALRWSSPAVHFMRYATRDVVLHDVRIREGDAVAAWLPSANRDESVFDRPYRLDLRRSPSGHVTFGSGIHRCVGQPLAKLTLRIVFDEFFTHLGAFGLAGPPVHLVSNAVAGLVSLPLRIDWS